MAPFHLVDFTQIEDEVLREQRWAGVLGFVQKHIFTDEAISIIKTLMPWIHQLSNSDELPKPGRIVVKYLLSTGNNDDRYALTEAIIKAYPKEKELIMTFAEQYRQEGLKQGLTFAEQYRQEGLKQGLTFAEQYRQEGLEQERRQIAKNLLDDGVDKCIIAKNTGLSLTELQELNNND